MANKLIRDMGLPASITAVFTARNITNAKDALSLTEFELMELLGVGLKDVSLAVDHISKMVSPPRQTALSLMQQHIRNERLGGHLPTRLKGLDEALCGGIPFGVLTELVGPAGIGKTQFCFMLSILASLPESFGGLDGQVVYIDLEFKFSSKRLIEIGAKNFPEVFCMKEMAQKMAGRILVFRPQSLSEFTESLQQIKMSLLTRQVKLLIIDSMAALVSGDSEQGNPKQNSLGWHISFLKSIAEFSRVPIVVTNQVRSHNSDQTSLYSFQGGKGKDMEDDSRYDSHLVAALGINWAHSVTVRLILDSKSGQKFIKVAKSPMSPPLGFPFHVTSSGISLLDENGVELMGPEISRIHNQGHRIFSNLVDESML
ncbi:hypothetical protein SAY87_001911 [Trapa incisa]|uniref:RecA family profile 1 domain-containing protein n=2 Tax=Trapa TaxID=22665 RepID=A0AAN7KI58_TRANT|nr:hypothetical protein SAY87_001911 [Trapa incisa]KAK4765524.1 hypothetical protein SAY86_026614 [Trapa natans]